MEWGTTTLGFYSIGAAALAGSALTLRRRIELSQAKHASLAGHGRMALRLARLLPFYEFGADRFFCTDNAPADVAARRRAGFERLAALYQARFAETIRHSQEAGEHISDQIGRAHV